MDARTWHQHATAAPVSIPDGATESAKAIRSALGAVVLPAAHVDALGGQLTELFEDNLDRPPGSQSIIALSAPYASGKSTMINRWAQQIYRSMIPASITADQPDWYPSPSVLAGLVPVVAVTLIAASGVKELNSQILTFLGYPAEGLARVTTTRVVEALARHRVRLLILDDAHMLTTTDRGSRVVLDYLKFLNTELGHLNGTMVLVGAHLDDSPILIDPQIRGRLHTFTLQPFGISTAKHKRDWQRFLKTAEAILLPAAPALEAGVFSRTHAGHIWRRTQGYLGDASRLLTHTVRRAHTTGAATITRDDLDAITLSRRAHDAEADLILRA